MPWRSASVTKREAEPRTAGSVGSARCTTTGGGCPFAPRAVAGRICDTRPGDTPSRRAISSWRMPADWASAIASRRSRASSVTMRCSAAIARLMARARSMGSAMAVICSRACASTFGS